MGELDFFSHDRYFPGCPLGQDHGKFRGGYLSYLCSRVAKIKGYQGEIWQIPDTIAATAKHFAAYGFAEAGRDYNTVHLGENELHNTILPPFKAAVDAGLQP
jgi:hypothetical protein